MKKQLLLGLGLIFATACGSSSNQSKEKTAAQETPSATEAIKTEPVKEAPASGTSSASKIQNGMLIGEIEKNDFLSPPFDSWFNANYDNYSPDLEAMEKISANLSDIDLVRVYMGTWCPDSRREVPKFFKLLETSGYDLDNVEMIAMDRSKTATDGSHELYNILRVPTFVFYKNGEETGRFVERPRESLEKDVAKILTGEEYKHSYEN